MLRMPMFPYSPIAEPRRIDHPVCAALRWLRDFLLLAQPPLLFKEGKRPKEGATPPKLWAAFAIFGDRYPKNGAARPNIRHAPHKVWARPAPLLAQPPKDGGNVPKVWARFALRWDEPPQRWQGSPKRSEACPNFRSFRDLRKMKRFPFFRGISALFLCIISFKSRRIPEFLGATEHERTIIRFLGVNHSWVGRRSEERRVGKEW